MLHEVLRKFKAEGRQLTVGEIVETSHWKNWRLLKEHRFIGTPSTPQAETAEIKADTKPKKEKPNEPPGKDSKAEPLVATIPRATGVARPSVLTRPGGKRLPVVGKVPAARAKG